MTTREFVKKLDTENQALVEKLQACKAPEEAYAIAIDSGLTDTFDTFAAEMTKLYESVKDLSDEDMNNVAGGISDEEIEAGLAKIVTDLEKRIQKETSMTAVV